MPDAATFAPTIPDLRRMMVDCQLRPFDVTDQRVLAAMQTVAREKFVGAENAAIAYSDGSLTVKSARESRKLLAPMVLARMIQGADITGQSRVLDVAGAGGYSAAVLAQLAGEVVALESDTDFVNQANAAFRETGVANARAVCGPLEGGYPQGGPFDSIIVNGAVARGLETLLGQLAPGGRLVCIERQIGQIGLAGKATRYDNVGGGFGTRTLFDAAGSLLTPFAPRPAFAF